METKKTVNVAFFDAKPYDIDFFTKANRNLMQQAQTDSKIVPLTIDFLEPHLNEQTAPLAKGHEVVCAFVNDKISAAVAESLYKDGVRLIALRCAGYNNVDLKAVYGKIPVVRVPAYSPYSVAEYASALLLSLTRKTPQAFNRTRDGDFRLDGLTGRDLHGRTAGIIGTGKIGKIMADILIGYGMKVLAYDAFPDKNWSEQKNIPYVSLDDLFSQSDVISLHCPLTPETHHIIDENAFKAIKQDAVIINTGRGALIDTKALVEALKSGKLGGAALDVYEEETAYFYEDWSHAIIQDDVLARLLIMPNVIISSHQAFLTEEALSAIAQTTLNNIQSYLNNENLENEICYQCANGKKGDCKKKKDGRCF